jgi:hypothetical protein
MAPAYTEAIVLFKWSVISVVSDQLVLATRKSIRTSEFALADHIR